MTPGIKSVSKAIFSDAPKKGEPGSQKSFHTHAIQKMNPHSKDKCNSLAATYQRSKDGGTLRIKNSTCLVNGGRLSACAAVFTSAALFFQGAMAPCTTATPQCEMSIEATLTGKPDIRHQQWGKGSTKDAAAHPAETHLSQKQWRERYYRSSAPHVPQRPAAPRSAPQVGRAPQKTPKAPQRPTERENPPRVPQSYQNCAGLSRTVSDSLHDSA